MLRIRKSVKTGLISVIIAIVCLSVNPNYAHLVIVVSPSGQVKTRPSKEATGTGGTIANGNTSGLIEPEVLTEEEIKMFSMNITNQNEEQKIYNLEKFGPLTVQSSVIVIQVHSRFQYLSLLVESLSRVRGIKNSLIIFSHDLYVPLMNEVIQNINFTRVMQIFFPFTIQLNPNRFPGQSPDDCPRNISREEARQIKCQNADHPDIHGHYREARYTQTKHHWWWKANFVFENIRALRNYNGVITFLEEDYYVAPDFLWILRVLNTLMSQNLCEGCNLFSVGTYLGTWNIVSSHDRALLANWAPGRDNMGMSFNRTLWKKIKACADTFCKFDDYNWDWSLLPVSDKCLNTSLKVLYPKTPKVFHIGDCGIHHKKELCNPTLAAESIYKSVKQFQSLLFPDNLIVEVLEQKKTLKKENGGWGDLRDNELCLSFLQ